LAVEGTWLTVPAELPRPKMLALGPRLSSIESSHRRSTGTRPVIAMLLNAMLALPSPRTRLALFGSKVTLSVTAPVRSTTKSEYVPVPSVLAIWSKTSLMLSIAKSFICSFVITVIDWPRSSIFEFRRVPDIVLLWK